jgi:RHH-type rel operon transcriptional repressor/antitoxin RelB
LFEAGYSREEREARDGLAKRTIDVHAKPTPAFSIRLPQSIDARLSAVAKKTGRSKASLAREAILENIEDREDRYLALARSQRNLKTIPLDDVERRLGLDR